MDKLRNNPWVVLVVLCLGFFMILLDTTIVNIAIPSIIDALNASLDQILWVLNGYIMVYAVLLITAGRMGDIHGPRNLFALGMVLFLAASAVCGLAQDTNQLIAARIVQGLGGALLTPQTLSIITTIFPSERRGAAFGLWGAVAGVAAVAGPTLGGFIITSWNWRWIFFVNLPIGAVALVATFLIVPDVRPGRRHKLDLVGVVLASVGLFAIVFALIEGQRFAWGTIWNWLTIPEVIAAGVVVLFLFLLWERAQVEPLIPLSLFRDRNFTVANVIGTAVVFGVLGMYLPFTIYLQSVLGMSAFAAGLTIAPISIVSMVVAPIAGRLSDKVGGKYLLMVGLVLFAAGIGFAGLTAQPDSVWSDFTLPFMFAGLGQGFVFAPMTAIAMRHITPRMAGAAAGVLNTTRQLGMLIGSAVVGAVLQTQLASTLYQEAVGSAQRLPAAFQDRFVQGVGDALKGGLEIGRTQNSALQLPPGIPQEAVVQIQQVFHEAFGNGFVAAMRPTVVVPVIVLVLGAVTCIGLESRERAAARAATVDLRQTERAEENASS